MQSKRESAFGNVEVSNEAVRAKIQQAIGPQEDLLTGEKRRKLQWYGHVSRSSGLAKPVLQDTLKGGRRQGRQKKRWEDNIRLEVAKSKRTVGTEKNGGDCLWSFHDNVDLAGAVFPHTS